MKKNRRRNRRRKNNKKRIENQRYSNINNKSKKDTNIDNENTYTKGNNYNIDNETSKEITNEKDEENNKNQKNKAFSKISLLLSLLLILGGFCIFAYPNVSNYFAEKNQVQMIREYEEMVVQVDEEMLSEEWQKAQTYNENLSGEPVHDPFVAGSGYALPDNYTDVLNISGNGVMAYIQIPKISVNLPIYHGTSTEVLEKGVGHIQSTSVPIGGTSTHCVLTGHTGLPSAELFTRLDELDVGDIFYIHVLNDILTYKIYEIKVILPDKIDELQVTSGRDLVTLVTCTPYGVNSHRLLVKAERTEYEEYVNENTENKTDSTENTGEQNTNQGKNYYLNGVKIGVVILLILLFILLVIIIILKIKKSKKSKH